MSGAAGAATGSPSVAVRSYSRRSSATFRVARFACSAAIHLFVAISAPSWTNLRHSGLFSAFSCHVFESMPNMSMSSFTALR